MPRPSSELPAAMEVLRVTSSARLEKTPLSSVYFRTRRHSTQPGFQQTTKNGTGRGGRACSARRAEEGGPAPAGRASGLSGLPARPRPSPCGGCRSRAAPPGRPAKLTSSASAGSAPATTLPPGQFLRPEPGTTQRGRHDRRRRGLTSAEARVALGGPAYPAALQLQPQPPPPQHRVPPAPAAPAAPAPAAPAPAPATRPSPPAPRPAARGPHGAPP